MKILHVASECYPLIKTGGLADVLGALPLAQQAQGDDVRIVLPYYHQIKQLIPDAVEVARRETFAGELIVRYCLYQGIGLYLLDAPHLYDRQGNPYHNEAYQDYSDNVFRFALLSWAAAALATGLDSWWGKVDVIHMHDWQAGLAAAYLYHWQTTEIKRIFTIHNIAYQGLFAAKHIPEVWLPWEMFQVDGLEFHGQLSFLKAGLYYADKITTVSPTYAQEICSAPAANGMEGLLSTRAAEGRLVGVLNGVDKHIWNPKTDSHLVKNYSFSSIQHKKANKSALLKMFHLPDRKLPLLVMVTRLTAQKGADVLASVLEQALEKGQLPYQFILLGSGSPELENWYRYLAERAPESIAIHIGYDEALAHRLIAGGDVILVPSRFEPCGLTQLYGLKYGTLPLVRRTGGLADTVNDTNTHTFRNKSATGFSFESATTDDLQAAINRMLSLWGKPKQWYQVVLQAMQKDFGWDKAAKAYHQLYLQ